MSFLSGIEPEWTEEDDAQICQECGTLYYGLTDFCYTCQLKIQVDELGEREGDLKREQGWA